MFYSRFHLATNGPLAMVWCAAYLQHWLRKSHFTSTNISSAVEQIMFSEVPISLRMSGHLLLGVARLYSKQVEYAFQDCTAVMNRLKKAFASIELDLTKDETLAPVQSITFPERFDLDSVDLGDELYYDGIPDNHLRSQEEITLTDPIPAGGSPYVAVTFDDEDIVMGESSHPEMVPSSDIRMTEEISTLPLISEREVPNGSRSDDMNFGDAGPVNQTEMLDTMLSDENINLDVPEREILRDAVHDFGLDGLPPVFPHHGDNMAETNRSLDQITREKETISPIMEDNLMSGGQFLPSEQRSAPPSDASQEAVSFGMAGDLSPGLGIIRSTPPVNQPEERPRRRRKQFFDQSIVLSNKVMRKSLEDTSGKLRKRRDAPCSALAAWKLKNTLMKEQIFHQSSLSGLCTDLSDIFKNDYISSKPNLIVSEESLPGPSPEAPPVSTTDPIPEHRVPRSPSSAPELDMEIEHPRNVEAYDSSNFFPEFVPSPARFTPLVRHDFSHATTSETEVLRAPEVGASPGVWRSELERPMTPSEALLDLENTGFPDVPGFMISAETDELNFLEADANTPTGFQGIGGVDLLSVRSRATTQYLKRCSPINPTLDGPFGDLSLNKILEGRTRKLCARMFFETLVLKSYGLIDVQQEEPYGDISLKLTPALSRAQI